MFVRPVFALVPLLAVCLCSAGEARISRHHGHESSRHGHESSRSSEPDQVKGRQARPIAFAAALDRMVAACRQEANELTTILAAVELRAIQLNREQRDAFEQVKIAGESAAERLDAACPKSFQGQLSEKLVGLDSTLKLMADSLRGLRVALIGFYGLLDDESVQPLNMSIPTSRPSQSRSGKAAQTQLSPPDPADAAPKAKCTEWAETLKSLPFSQIEQTTSLSDFQRAGLYELMATIYRSAGDLVAACPTQERQSPFSALSARENVLRALGQDIQEIEPFAAAFENTLSEGQRTALEATISPSPEINRVASNCRTRHCSPAR
jgi:hypothetical protein